MHLDLALLGFGNVGQELAQMLLDKRDEVLSRLREEEHRIDALGTSAAGQGGGDAPPAGS